MSSQTAPCESRQTTGGTAGATYWCRWWAHSMQKAMIISMNWYRSRDGIATALAFFRPRLCLT